MISRIYVAQKKIDNRKKSYLGSWKSLGLSGKIKDIEILDSYKIEHNFTKSDLEKTARTLSNEILEKYYINTLPHSKKFSWLIEIGYLPGVTDNVGNTVKESIADLFHLKNKEGLAVYTSKVFLIFGKINRSDVKKITSSMYNPLIESSYIANFEEFEKQKSIPLKVPEVKLTVQPPVLKISLDVGDEELTRMGKEGIMDPGLGKRRGPLALSLPYMQAIKKYFKDIGRDPTDVELESLAQTWSEHCKHTIFANPIDDIKDGLYKTYIKEATNKIRKKKGRGDFCVSVFNDNSGAVLFDDNFLITHKVETHNSPSALDPFGGAVTGIVGVNRDTIGFGLGAKPVANVYGFCVGNPEDKRALFRDKKPSAVDRPRARQKMFPPKRIMDGVIKGVNFGGNTSGIPTPHGFIKFDDRYRGKPLVFAGTVGLIPRKLGEKYLHQKKAELGDYIVMIGGRVGADGIHGATFSSLALDSGSPATAVQIGDPITQKKLSDVIIREARNMNLYNSITDNGAGGLSCSVAEMARECGGAIVNLEKVPLKYSGLSPWQIWISESQERMTLAVPKKKWEVFAKLMKSRGVEATIIGEFTEETKCKVCYDGKIVMSLDMEFLHNGLPKEHLQTIPWPYKNSEIKIKDKNSYTKKLLLLLENKNVGSFDFISEQYDHEVQSSSVLKPISGNGRINTDAQIIHPVLDSKKGAVISSSLYPSYGDLSTYHMSACAVDTTIRNMVSAGGTLNHLSILDNFCWCSSNDRSRLAQLVDGVMACHDCAVGYSTPFISGKDSMFNDFRGYDDRGRNLTISIPPTLLISGLSVIKDVNKTISPEFKESGDVIYLLGETNRELGGGEYLKTIGIVEGGDVPKVDIRKNLKTYSVLEELIEKEILSSAMSVNSGGLGVALAKASMGGGFGSVSDISKLPGEVKFNFEKLFSESQGRVLVSLKPDKVKTFEKITKNITCTKLGYVTKNSKFIIINGKKKLIESSIKNIHASYHKFSNQNK